MSDASTTPSTAAQLVTRALRHPWTMRLKRGLRDIRWRMAGRACSNPPLPPQARSVVFVCLGNICRSPFAEHLAARALAGRGARLDVRSAGLRITQANRSPADAVAVARTYDVHLDAHVPVQFDQTHAGADVIVVMEPVQREWLLRLHPDAAGRVVLLPLFDAEASGYDRCHIDDPFLGSPREFQACYRRIDRAVGSLVAALCETGTRGHS